MNIVIVKRRDEGRGNSEITFLFLMLASYLGVKKIWFRYLNYAWTMFGIITVDIRFGHSWIYLINTVLPVYIYSRKENLLFHFV